jgi:hypothetical protein
VRIPFRFAGRVVLAMHRDPLEREHAGSDPKPKTKEMTDDGMQGRSVCLVTVKKDRDTHDRHVGQCEGNRDVTPESRLDKRHQFVAQDCAKAPHLWLYDAHRPEKRPYGTQLAIPPAQTKTNRRSFQSKECSSEKQGLSQIAYGRMDNVAAGGRRTFGGAAAG